MRKQLSVVCCADKLTLSDNQDEAQRHVQHAAPHPDEDEDSDGEVVPPLESFTRFKNDWTSGTAKQRLNLDTAWHWVYSNGPREPLGTLRWFANDQVLRVGCCAHGQKRCKLILKKPPVLNDNEDLGTQWKDVLEGVALRWLAQSRHVRESEHARASALAGNIVAAMAAAAASEH